jgi:hypothetical protein
MGNGWVYETLTHGSQEKSKNRFFDSKIVVLGFKQGTGDYFLLNLES